MSDLYRSALSARIAQLPADVADISDTVQDDEEGEETDGLGELPGSGMGPPAMPFRNFRSSRRQPNPQFAPIPLSGYFDSAAQVTVSSRNLDMRVYHTPPKFADGTLIICHHGAGYSAASFACFSKEVAAITDSECGVLAVDSRRHGKTVCADADDADLSIDVLVEDLFELLKILHPDPQTAPVFLLLGHSMGGSVVVRACSKLLSLKYKVAGVAVLDVVEGSALEALPHMHSLLNARPEGFNSLEEAIEWHVSTNTIRNSTSARISIPPIFTHVPDDKVPYRWRTPLRSTAPYWTSWFSGLSKSFLASRTARLLVLAGTERLDKELMIGQMQGKFQLVVVPGVGHMLHEDNPTRLAEILVEFWRRNDKVIAGIKKVGDE